MATDLSNAAKAYEDLHKLSLAAERWEGNTELKLRMQEQHSKGESWDSASVCCRPIDGKSDIEH